jgi:hypothetical protein
LALISLNGLNAINVDAASTKNTTTHWVQVFDPVGNNSTCWDNAATWVGIDCRFQSINDNAKLSGCNSSVFLNGISTDFCTQVLGPAIPIVFTLRDFP